VAANKNIGPTVARIGDDVLNDHDLQSIELDRAHKALAYLKNKIGDGIVPLLQEELDISTAQMERYAADSNGEWKSGFVVVKFDGVGAQELHDFFMGMVKAKDELALRAAHPEHFLTRIKASGPEIIENVGADDYPWYINGAFSPIDQTIPGTADSEYPIGFALTIRSVSGMVVGYALHELRDTKDGMQAKLTIVLPKTAPDRLIRGHSEHFAVEFRNWRIALAAKSHRTAGVDQRGD
jgi:hypothetical protein